jgi:hypothetical protein
MKSRFRLCRDQKLPSRYCPAYHGFNLGWMRMEFPRWPIAGKHMQWQNQFGRDNDTSNYGLKSRKNCGGPVMGLVMTFCPPMTIGVVELVCQATGEIRLVANSSV